jgi:hypothetical protein
VTPLDFMPMVGVLIPLAGLVLLGLWRGTSALIKRFHSRGI